MSKAQDATASLYRKEPKVYPRDVTGTFAGLRKLAVVVLLGLYYILPWLNWDGHQSVLFDLPATEILYSGTHLLAAGFYFPGPDADHRRAVPVFRHGRRWPAVVWLCLPANRLDRSVSMDGAPG